MNHHVYWALRQITLQTRKLNCGIQLPYWWMYKRP